MIGNIMLIRNPPKLKNKEKAFVATSYGSKRDRWGAAAMTLHTNDGTNCHVGQRMHSKDHVVPH